MFLLKLLTQVMFIFSKKWGGWVMQSLIEPLLSFCHYYNWRSLEWKMSYL